MQPDFFEDEAFALRVGNFVVTGEAGRNVRVRNELSKTTLFEMKPEQAIAFAEALRSVAVCAKFGGK